MSPNFLLSFGIHRSNFSATEFVVLNNFQILVDGGTACMFWSYCWVIFGQFFIVLSLAEMSSMAPTAGGLAATSPQPVVTVDQTDRRD